MGVLTALISVALALFANYLYDLYKHSRKRNSGLRILFSQLQNHKKQLNVLENSLLKNQIYAALDPTPIFNFLNSAVINLTEDEKLIESLYTHVQNIETIKHALNRIDMKSAGFTSVQMHAKTELEENLKAGLAEIEKDLDLCLNELLRYKCCSSYDK